MRQRAIDTIQQLFQGGSSRAGSATVQFAVIAIWAISAASPGLGQEPAQPTFSSAAEATQSLFDAVQSGNEAAIANILGASTDLTSSRDEGQDILERQLFVGKYEEMHRLGYEGDRSATLYIGAENWPFPIPLVRSGAGWRFDTDAGLKEVLYRRIGANELAAIAVCHDFAAAAKHHRAAANSENPEDGSGAEFAARMATQSSGGGVFHGYYFRPLPASPGDPTGKAGSKANRFAIIAYPVEYRSSGVMTFVVTDKDVVYQKDLGAGTSALAGAITSFHKDATWRTE